MLRRNMANLPTAHNLNRADAAYGIADTILDTALANR
jgi:hypothetical protein